MKTRYEVGNNTDLKNHPAVFDYDDRGYARALRAWSRVRPHQGAGDKYYAFFHLVCGTCGSKLRADSEAREECECGQTHN